MEEVRVALARAVPDALDADLRPGEYRATPRDRRYHAVTRCAHCQRLVSVSRVLHAVDWEGRVSPGLWCPHGDCRFGGTLVMLAWVPEPRGSA